jgi:hypothetical protein
MRNIVFLLIVALVLVLTGVFYFITHQPSNTITTDALSPRAQEFLASHSANLNLNIPSKEPVTTTTSLTISTPCYSFQMPFPYVESNVDSEDPCLLRTKLGKGGLVVTQRWTYSGSITDFSSVQMRLKDPTHYKPMQLQSPNALAFWYERDLVIFVYNPTHVVTIAFTNIRDLSQLSPETIENCVTSVVINAT